MRHILRPVIYVQCTVSTSQNKNLCVERQSFPDCCVLTNSNRNLALQLEYDSKMYFHLFFCLLNRFKYISDSHQRLLFRGVIPNPAVENSFV